MHPRTTIALLGTLAAITACGAEGGDSAASDAARSGPPPDAVTGPSPDAGGVSAPDAGPDAAVVPGCACEANETCAGCIAHISECCYGDREAYGQVAAIAATCEANGACRVCCRECEATPCDALRAGGSCPFKNGGP